MRHLHGRGIQEAQFFVPGVQNDDVMRNLGVTVKITVFESRH